jgi:hypothetical protein
LDQVVSTLNSLSEILRNIDEVLHFYHQDWSGLVLSVNLSWKILELELVDKLIYFLPFFFRKIG